MVGYHSFMLDDLDAIDWSKINHCKKQDLRIYRENSLKSHGGGDIFGILRLRAYPSTREERIEALRSG